MDRLQAELDADVRPARQFLDQIERLVGNAVAAGADGQADDLRMRKRCLVNRAEFFERSVRVRRGLEIGQELVADVASLQPADAVVDLFQNGLLRNPPRRAEAAVIAKDAAPPGDRAVDVGAGEPGVDADLLDPLAELAAEEKIVFVVAQACRLPRLRRRGRQSGRA
jgi:hypothetical protein